MSDERAKLSVFCVRNHVGKSAAEHLECPYCFGKKREVVEGGDRKQFCDYDAKTDPVTFGFPEGTSRNVSG
ncbi:MAG: hypothetical protein HY908_37170 [Myxococcales bacterium]|nr:hypothetical protein [Myxococcales bacterium]